MDRRSHGCGCAVSCHAGGAQLRAKLRIWFSAIRSKMLWRLRRSAYGCPMPIGRVRLALPALPDCGRYRRDHQARDTDSEQAAHIRLIFNVFMN
jgi:hypothetical protein